MRTVIVNGQMWRWKVGKRRVVVRGCGVRLVVSCGELCGVTPDEYDRAAWKGNHYAITPKMIADFIVRSS